MARAYNIKRNTEKDFWALVNKNGSCWEKSGYSDKDGYKFFNYQGKEWRAHRLAYTFAHGPISEDMVVMHSCDNPSCCNPEHLSAGTPKDNTQDMLSKNRGRWGLAI